MDPIEALGEIAKAGDGKINEVGLLPDGSGFATMSFPLRKDHWIYRPDSGEDYDSPPMPFRMGSEETCYWGKSADGRSAAEFTGDRQAFADKIREAGRYAVRGATMCGKEMDFDPDALLQNLVTGMLGYWTEDGLSSDDWANPPHLRKEAK